MHDLKRGFLPMAAVMFLTGMLLLSEPDFGAFVVIVSIAMGILFLGGLNWRLFAGLIVVLLAGFAALILSSAYRRERLFNFLDPFKDPYGSGYQLSHALIAFGRGEWLGLGLGGSVEKLFYLPEAHTDFLLAVIAEEFGFVGVVVGDRIVRLAYRQGFPDRPSRRATGTQQLRAGGAGHRHLARRAGAHHMGVNVGLLPTKGLTPALPVVRRQRHPGQLPGHRRAAAHRLGAPSDERGKTF